MPKTEAEADDSDNDDDAAGETAKVAAVVEEAVNKETTEAAPVPEDPQAPTDREVHGLGGLGSSDDRVEYISSSVCAGTRNVQDSPSSQNR